MPRLLRHSVTVRGEIRGGQAVVVAVDLMEVAMRRIGLMALVVALGCAVLPLPVQAQ